ncbi:hypothetical protein CCYN2B_90015 [Capnocytophaga cynodegmi]|uniref:Uncharacterized protein n=1 Tax=Capnocytophaga cynodegmi TaxID=28189 RepID=A0A0B7HJR4_9FLAO|nr:hypothetical protein CCYN2B_90015 [Capnocytophaga cynodegmi]
MKFQRFFLYSHQITIYNELNFRKYTINRLFVVVSQFGGR